MKELQSTAPSQVSLQNESSSKLACGQSKTINTEKVEPDAIDAATAPFCIQCNAAVKTAPALEPT